MNLKTYLMIKQAMTPPWYDTKKPEPQRDTSLPNLGPQPTPDWAIALDPDVDTRYKEPAKPFKITRPNPAEILKRLEKKDDSVKTHYDVLRKMGDQLDKEDIAKNPNGSWDMPRSIGINVLEAEEKRKKQMLAAKKLSYLKFGLGGAALGAGTSAIMNMGADYNPKYNLLPGAVGGIAGLLTAYLHNRFVDKHEKTPLEALYDNSIGRIPWFMRNKTPWRFK